MPNKGKKPAGGARGSKEQCAKKSTGKAKPADKTTAAGAATAEKKSESTSASTSGAASGTSTAASAGSSKVLPSQDKTMKAADPKAQTIPKTEPPKSTQASEPKSTTASAASSSAAAAAAKPSTGKGPAKQDAKADPGKQKADSTAKTTPSSSSTTAKPSKEKGPSKHDVKADSKASSSVAGKAAAGAVGAAAVGAAAVGAAAVGAAASVSSSAKPKDQVKEEKKVSADKTAAAAAAAPGSSEKEDALDLLIDTLGGPETVPESPKFTGPEIADTPATSEYIEELGKRESTIPPEYRHLLDGKGEKPTAPPPKADEESLGDDDLIATMSSQFVSAPPEEKKPKLEEKKTAQSASTAPVASLPPTSAALTDEALDELLGTLEPPPSNEPESPQFTGPEVMETGIASSYLEELGIREHTIPPKYRHLLDGKDDHGKLISPPADAPEPAMSDSELVDHFSKEFESSVSPTPPAADKPQDTTKDKQTKPDVVVQSSASSVQAAAAPSAGMEEALDALMGTLEGPEFRPPESPVYTGPVVTETAATSTYVDELGKREGSIPPKYRHLLDGKEGGKPAPPHAEEKSMTDSELLDAIDKDFTCPQPPAAQQTPTAKPQNVDVKKTESEAVVKSSSSSSSKVQAAPAPSKAPTCKADPLDALSGTLGVRQEDPKDKKPVTDKIKEKTGKGTKEKLGEDEETIPPDYRLKEVKDKDGKPLLPKPEEKPMSEDDLLDALTEGFITSPTQCTPSQSIESVASGSEEIVSSKASSVQSGAPVPPESSINISDDALDLLSGSLGTRQEDPEDKKPIVDVVKERAKEERIARLGDRDDTIPPEYRHLLDGKDQGKPAKPEEIKPEAPLDDNAAIDALSSGLASCDTRSSDKAKSSLKDKTEQSTSNTLASQSAGKTPDASKSKNDKSTPASQTAENTPDASKPTSQSTSTKPSEPKTCKS